MANTILTSGVRQNLLSLQQTTSEQGAIQNRLATGKRVNSAIDNPVNFFTSLGLNDRAGELKSLLDGISNGIQTITAASQGVDSITKLVQSLQSTIKQAQADAVANRPKTTGSLALATAGEAALTNKSLKDIALDKVIGGADAVANTATASTPGDLGIDTSGNPFISLTLSAGPTTYRVALSPTQTVRDLVNAVNASGVATASVDETGRLNITGAGSSTLRVGLATGATQAAADAAAITATNSNTLIGLAAADATTGLSATGSSTVRSNLIKQFNDITAQIDQLAKDAGFNGKNLLQGDKLSIVFNEKTGSQQSKLDIQGSILSAANIGILQAASADVAGVSFNIQDDAALATTADTLTGALVSLRSVSSGLGSNLSVVQTRQDFTKNLVNTLTTGADNLVLADSNEEGAKLLALNTRQQLSQTALSLASQADQGVLRLFG